MEIKKCDISLCSNYFAISCIKITSAEASAGAEVTDTSVSAEAGASVGAEAGASTTVGGVTAEAGASVGAEAGASAGEAQAEADCKFRDST